MIDVLKILADTTRLRLLRILQKGDFTVQDLMCILNMGQSRVSRHLILMSQAGLLKVEKQGTWRYYRLSAENSFFNKVWPTIEQNLYHVEHFERDTQGVLDIMNQRRERTKSFFEQHAHEWDDIHTRLLHLPNYHDELLSLIPRGGLAMDVGVGPGTLLSDLCQVADHVIAIDHSPAMVTLARQKVKMNNLEHRVDVRLAEMLHLPASNQSVRTVVINQVLHHAEHPGEVFKEVKRVMEPQARLVLADLIRHELDWARDRLGDQWLGFQRKELETWLDSVNLKINFYKEFITRNSHPGVFLLSAS